MAWWKPVTIHLGYLIDKGRSDNGKKKNQTSDTGVLDKNNRRAAITVSFFSAFILF